MRTTSRSILILAILALTATCAHPVPRAVTVKGDTEGLYVGYQSPEDCLETMQFQPGYRMELVAAEPMVQEPCLCVWDGNGRMYVAELRTYMQDADGSGKFDPVSRVIRMEDTDNDGVMDKRTIFADKLLLPRVVLPLGNKVIIGETNTLDLFSYEDTDGDGVSDKKELWFAGGKRGGNLEHQPSGLIWAIDNWIYRTYGTYRVQLRDGKVVKEDCPGAGQWGLTSDDEGKVIFVNGGSEKGPEHFNTHTVYGKNGGTTTDEYKTVWPRDNIPDVQGGLRRLRDNNTLNHFTATCGQSIYRAHRLPPDFYGNLIFCEPVGRLIRRSVIREVLGETKIVNAYDKDEFITSTDPNFRPVNSAIGPDGCLYIVDMYRGIIQEGNWVKKGSYLRKVVDKLGLAENFMRGRIWRVVHDDFKRGTTRPQMIGKPAKELIQFLAHENGWWRDTAQKLIVVSRDTSVAGELMQMSREHAEPLARMHALWTLEGLGIIDRELLFDKLRDVSVIVQCAALRISEELLRKGDVDLLLEVLSLTKSKKPQLLKQLALTLSRSCLKDVEAALKRVQTEHPKITGVHDLCKKLIDVNRRKVAAENKRRLMKEKERLDLISFNLGKELYGTLCFTCHGKDGNSPASGPQKMAPVFKNSLRLKHVDKASLIKTVLHGMTGPLGTETFVGVMVPMSSYSDAQIAGVMNYIRNSFGNTGKPYLDAKFVAGVRKTTKDQKTPCTEKALLHEAPDYKKIHAAVPATAPASVTTKKKKILVLSDSRGNHRSPNYAGILMLEAMSEKTGAFDVVFSTDVADFSAESLAGYDAVFINNASSIEKAVSSKKDREALIQFVKNGGGFAAIHAAAEGGWKEYTTMLGARSNGTPWRAGDTWGVRVEDPDHPLARAFDGKNFKIKDEIFRFTSYSRDKLRVLMTVDPKVGKKKNGREDKDNAVSWIREYGKGRVFYCSLGHNAAVFRNKAVLGHWLAGIQYVLGDLDADATSLPQPKAQ